MGTSISLSARNYQSGNLNLFTLTRYGKWIVLVPLIFCVISIWWIAVRSTPGGHHKNNPNHEPTAPSNYLTAEQKLFYDILNPICVPLSNTQPARIHHIFDPDPVFFNRSDLHYLTQYCAPYVYTRIYLGIGNNEKGDCAPDAKERGDDCKWYHMCTWPADEDRFVSKAILKGGVWELDLVEVAIQMLSNTSKGLVLDTGANIGEYTVLAAALGHTVFAYEPLHDHVTMLKLTTKLNGFQHRVHIFRNGVSDYLSSVNLNLNKNNKGGSTIDRIDSTEDETIGDARFNSRVTIDLITMDDTLPYINDLYPNMDILFWKADIEGYESRMFRGAYRLFADRKPPFIIFELLGKSFPRTQCSFTQLLPAMKNLGYKIMDLDGKEWSPDKLDGFLANSDPDYLKTVSMDIRLELENPSVISVDY